MTTKDAGLRIRIDRNLRERFLEICREQDKPASQVIREFMRNYIETYEIANDPSMRARQSRKAGLS